MIGVFAMALRLLSFVFCAVALLAAISSDADAQRRPVGYDQTVSGNDPVARFFGFSGAPVGRTTVSYPGSHRPGTIVINTRERRLYLVL